MRAALVLLVLTSTAFAQQAPSQTMERAIKLYDRKDFFSTSIELNKVIAGETNDDDAGKQRAVFFLGKTFYQMGFYAPSNSVFEQIASNPRHAYFTASAKWTAALLRLLPLEDIPAVHLYPIETADDSSVASVRDELLYAFGRAALDHGDFAGADKAFAKVAADSSFSAYAQLGLAISAVRNGKGKEALAAYKAVSVRNPKQAPQPSSGIEAYDLAQLGIAALAVDGKKWDEARAAAAKVSAGPPAARAAWEVVLAKAGKRGTSLGALEPYARTPVSLDGPEPALLQQLASCTDKADSLSAFHRDAATLAKELDALARENPDDDSGLSARRSAALHAGTGKVSARADPLVKAMLATPGFEQALAWRDELDHELTLLSKSDKAWQTTAVAADLLQELTVLRSVADADLGKRLRFRLRAVADGVRAIAADSTKLPCN